MPSREHSMRQKEEISAVCWDTFPTIHSHQPTHSPCRVEEFLILEKNATHGHPMQQRTSKPVVSLLHRTHPVCKYDGSVFAETSTEKLVARGEEQSRDTIFNSEICKETIYLNSNAIAEEVYFMVEQGYTCRNIL